MAQPSVGPFARGSVSIRLYPHDELAAPAIVTEMRAQAQLASESGFDGVMTSEHHGGFAGYLPNPLQLAGWLLEAMPQGWAAACPLLLPLRPAALVAEEVAWLAARFPGRVGVGVASGALPRDFEIMGMTMEDLPLRFADALATLAGMLGGTDTGRLAGDQAVALCMEHPIPVLSAAMGFTAVRRAAKCGVGLILDSMSSSERCRQLTDAYREAGGKGACVLIRRAWLGEPPAGEDRHVDRYRTYTPSSAQSHWGSNEAIVSTDPAAVAEDLADTARRAGADAVNLRVHVAGVSPEIARDKIVELGEAVVSPVRARLMAEPRPPGHPS